MTASSPDEAWGFEWGTADGNGGFVRLALHRAGRVAWYWAYLWRPGTGPVVVRDHEVTLPRGRALEIRADSLWSELVCETPGEHWSIGLEAFGVRLDSAADGLTGEIGERIALGFDFEWETTGDPFSSELAGVIYDEQPGVVRGDVLLGRDRIPLDTVGRFEHSVGPVDRIPPRERLSFALDDGSWWSLRGEFMKAPRSGARWVGGRVLPVGLSAHADPGYQAKFSGFATIAADDLVISRGIGSVESGGLPGTAWNERGPFPRAKIT
jgi:hypothetical protein